MISRSPVRGALISLISLIFAAPASSWGRQDVVPGSRFTSARAAALGDAFLPLGDDAAAGLFYNPASIGKIRGTQMEVSLGAHANGGFTDSLGLSSYNIYSLSANQANLAAKPNAPQGMGVSLLPTFAAKGFAFGLLMENQFMASSDASGNIRYRSLYQLVPTAGFGVRLAGGIVRLGYSIQYVNKAVGDVSAPSGTSELGYNQGLSEGSGLSHNVGFALTLPIVYLPSLNIVARNLAGVSYGSWSLFPVAGNSPGAPGVDPMTVDASFSIQPKVEAGAYMNLVVQYRDVTSTSGVAILGRLTSGAELSFRDFFFLRGGYGGGYPSAGLGFRMKKGEFSMSWFSEELGPGYHDLRDVRYMFQFKVRGF